MRPEKVTIVKMEDLGMRKDGLYLSRFTLSDGRVIESRCPEYVIVKDEQVQVTPEIRTVGDISELAKAGVEKEEIDKCFVNEIRCVKCKRLLMKIKGGELSGSEMVIEVKCSKCGYLDSITTMMRPTVFTYVDKPLKDAPTEALRDYLQREEEWWRPWDQMIRIRKAISKELESRI